MDSANPGPSRDHADTASLFKRLFARGIPSRTLMIVLMVSALAVSFAAIAYEAVYASYRAPESLSTSMLVTIPEGTTLTDAARILEDKGIITSAQLLEWLVLLQQGEQHIKAGDYYFDSSLTAGEATRRLLAGEFGLTPIRITIPEGATTYQMADILEDKLERFDAITFLERTKHLEGYLFPDTYLFLPNASIEDVVRTMESTLYEKIAPLEESIEASGFSLHDILTVASLLEREARWPEEKRMIAGILYHRLEIGMPLQVDAVFGYIYGRETFHPKFSHLEIDSPYNTYKHSGLPPGPIASPGLESIEAALNPIESPYLFYLTGRDGTMYYSESYEQHLVNTELYLR